MKLSTLSTTTTNNSNFTISTPCILLTLLIYRRRVFAARCYTRGLCRRAVSVRLFVRSSVTFVYSVETTKHILIFYTIG